MVYVCTDPIVTPPNQLPGCYLPGYFAYLSLGFKLISCVLIAGLMFIAIRRLPKPHNIWVANLMVADVIVALIGTFLTGGMMVGFATGIGVFISFHLSKFLCFPVAVLYTTFLMMSVDNVIAFLAQENDDTSCHC